MTKPTFTRKQIQAMSPDERARRVDELNEALSEGRIVDDAEGESR